MGPGRTSTVHGSLVRQGGCGWPETTTTNKKTTAHSNISSLVIFLFFAEIHVLGACICLVMTRDVLSFARDVLSFALVTSDSFPAKSTSVLFWSTQCELCKFCLTQCRVETVVAQHSVYCARVVRLIRCLLFLLLLSVLPCDETVSSCLETRCAQRLKKISCVRLDPHGSGACVSSWKHD